MIDQCQLQWHRGGGTGQGHWGNCNSNGATGQEQQEQGQQQQNRVATALGQGPQDSDCNGAMGHTIDRSYFDRVATATAAIDRLQRGNGNGATGATAIAMGHWGKSNRTVLQQNTSVATEHQCCNGATATTDRVAIAAQNVDNSGC
jgi:hypothetical protein